MSIDAGGVAPAQDGPSELWRGRFQNSAAVTMWLSHGGLGQPVATPLLRLGLRLVELTGFEPVTPYMRSSGL